MNPIRPCHLLSLAAFALLATAAPSLAHGDDDHAANADGEAAGHSHERAQMHGGAVTMTQAFHLETVFLPQEVRIYAYDAHQEPVDLRGTDLTGSVALQLRGGDGEAPQAPLHIVIPESDDDDGDDDHSGGDMMGMHDDDDHTGGTMMGMHDDDHTGGTMAMHHVHDDDQVYLAAALDLSGVAPGQARARIALTGLPSKAEPTVTYLQKVVVIAPADDDDEDDDGGAQQQGDPH